VDYDISKPLASRELMLKRMENYIKDVLTWCQTNYPGMIKMWVVTNESFHPGDNMPGSIRNDLWYKTIGEDYIKWAFEYAHKYREPGLSLVYNDFGMESNASKMDAILNYMDKHKVKLDGIGFQMHATMDRPNIGGLKNQLDKIKAKSYEVWITEMDVDTVDKTAITQAALRQRYYDIISTFLNADINLKGIGWWCLNDGYTWLITNKGGARYPLMFDANNQAKPAYYGVMEAAGVKYGMSNE
jgi:endo-1,4-beta-xylanase